MPASRNWRLNRAVPMPASGSSAILKPRMSWNDVGVVWNWTPLRRRGQYAMIETALAMTDWFLTRYFIVFLYPLVAVALLGLGLRARKEYRELQNQHATRR